MSQPMVYADRESSRRLYDDDYPSYEQLPRRFVARIEALPGEDGRSRARLFVNDEVTGDVLRDNAYIEDGYRFHDVFHIALAAGLGWSPVLRALLRRKRRSSPLVDEVEDGGRAIALDEAICLLVHDYAETNSFSLDPSVVDQEFVGLLRRLVDHLEVADRPNEDWWHTIHQATDAYLSIRNWGGGSLSVDLERGTLEAHAPESAPISV